MEQYSYASYPDSGDSSPRSREIDFENPPPWDDQSQPQLYKAKFMCSYGGKIHPRPHDNQLSYMGGETKILAVDRNIKFANMIAKLAALWGDADVSFKYQLPGEELDALISVTNDDDLEHMMHEYDRLFRASAKPARMRLFLFPVSPSPAASFGSDGGKSDRERFVEALNSGPSQVSDIPGKPVAPNNVDFLFGLDKGAPPPPPSVKVPDSPDLHVGPVHDDRVVGSDPVNLHTQMQRVQIREQEQQVIYRRNSDDNLVGGVYTAPSAVGGGDYYYQKMPEKVPPVSMPVNMPQTMTAPAGYWPEKHMAAAGGAAGGYQAAMTVTTTPPPQEQQVYMIPAPGPVSAPGPVYHAPLMRPVTGQAGQGYYVQRMGGPDVYREQQVYNVVPTSQPPPQTAAMAGHMGAVRPSGAGVAVTDAGYPPQVAYDNAVGRQVYYTGPGGGMVQQPPPHQYQGVSGAGGGGGGVVVSGGEMRPVVVGGPLGGQEGAKVVTKLSHSQGSV